MRLTALPPELQWITPPVWKTQELTCQRIKDEEG